jgi:AcrR family transcriptional regulator
MTSAGPHDNVVVGLRERGKQRRTEAILDAGLTLLREDPDQNLTVDRVAALAGVSPMTVFNLVGSREQLWSAMADRALDGLDLSAISEADPEKRAHRIVDAVVRILRSDAVVFRALLSAWAHSGRLLAHDPTEALIACLNEATTGTTAKPNVHVRRVGEVLAAGLVGTIHQWTAGVIGDRAFSARAHAVVDVAFLAVQG